MATKKDQATEADQATERTLTDPAMIRALTHPTRLTIMEHLADTDDAATATELARVVGLSPSATSYHLRALASWGLVEEAESQGDGRERRWRVIGRGLTLDADPGASPDFREAARGLVAVVLARADEQVNRWFAREAEEPAEWVDAVAINSARLLVTAAELAEINAAYRELLRPYLRRTRTDPPAGARVVTAHYRFVPSG